MTKNTPAGPSKPSSKRAGGGQQQPPQRDETDTFISEVSEELRRDRMNRAFRRYGPIAGGVIVLIVIASAGYEYWRYETRESARTAGGVLASAARSDEPGDAFRSAADTLTGGPAVVADLAAATALMQDGKTEEALPLYSEVGSREGIEPLYRQLAEIRSIMARVGAEPAEDLLQELTPLTGADAPFAPLALEIEAGLKLEKGDVEGARASIKAAQADPRTTGGQRQRLQGLLDSLPPEPGAAAEDEKTQPPATDG